MKYMDGMKFIHSMGGFDILSVLCCRNQENNGITTDSNICGSHTDKKFYESGGISRILPVRCNCSDQAFGKRTQYKTV